MGIIDKAGRLGRQNRHKRLMNTEQKIAGDNITQGTGARQISIVP